MLRRITEEELGIGKTDETEAQMDSPNLNKRENSN